jgi:hypothetical protein
MLIGECIMKTLRSIFIVFVIFSVIEKTYSTDGSSGCGPGWYLLKENSIVSSVLRTITNGILFPISTLGITFGTSNCTQHKLVRTEKESLYFATMNYFELKNEIAKGQGEFLSGFAQTIGCRAEDQKVFNKSLKTQYQNVVPSQGIEPEKLLKEVYKVILSNPQLVAGCSLRVS